MHVKKVYEKGAIFPAEVLDITTADILASFRKTISNLASVSIASGYITKPAIPHLIANSFKNLAAVTFETDYTFKQADALKEAAKHAATAVKAGPAKEEKKQAVVEEKPKEEEVDANMGDLFGDPEY